MAAYDFASLELDDAGDSREERVRDWRCVYGLGFIPPVTLSVSVYQSVYV